jgi:cytochrome b pre-mRNA-processing protein 3
MPIWPFRGAGEAAEAELLRARVTEASRDPRLFGAERVADTLEGRFELTALFASLALIRLKTDSKPLAQAFTDTLFRYLDAGLREAGVGDLSVPKKMRRLAGAFYGRLDAYASTLGLADQAAFVRAIGRNVFDAEDHAFAATLAQAVAGLCERQAGQPVGVLTSPEGWRISL